VAEGGLGGGEVADQRVEMRAALGGEDGGDGAAVGGVGAQAIDGFGAEGDEAAGAEQRRGVGDAGWIGSE
jgi:hypothetical protein